MPSEQEPIEGLGKFIDSISEIRRSWGLARHKELWFRGESKDYGKTILRPELYRPSSVDASLKPIWKLLAIENYLYWEFQRNAVNLTESSEGIDRQRVFAEELFFAKYLRQVILGPIPIGESNNGFLAEAEVWLLSAAIEGYLECDNAQLSDLHGFAILRLIDRLLLIAINIV